MFIPLLVPSNGRSSNIVEGGFCCKGRDFVYWRRPTADVSIGMPSREMISGSEGEEFERMVCTGYDAFMQWDGQLKKKVGLRKTKYAVHMLLWCLKAIELLIHAAHFSVQLVAGSPQCLVITILLLIGMIGSLI